MKTKNSAIGKRIIKGVVTGLVLTMSLSACGNKTGESTEQNSEITTEILSESTSLREEDEQDSKPDGNIETGSSKKKSHPKDGNNLDRTVQTTEEITETGDVPPVVDQSTESKEINTEPPVPDSNTEKVTDQLSEPEVSDNPTPGEMDYDGNPIEPQSGYGPGGESEVRKPGENDRYYLDKNDERLSDQ